MSSTDREIAIRAQEKFEFYLVSLVFTLLALSIQTSEFGISSIADIFELLGWVTLLVSGVAGLWRLEYSSLERVKLTQKNEFKDNIFKLRELQHQGQTELFVLEDNGTQEIAERIANFENAINVLNPIIKKLESSNIRKYDVHRYTFVLGVVFLLLSRSYTPASDLLSKLCDLIA